MKNNISIPEQDAKKAKIIRRIGIALCILALLVGVVVAIWTKTSGSCNGPFACMGLSLMAFFFAVPVFLIGLILVIHSILKIKGVKHAGLKTSLCILLIVVWLLVASIIIG